MPAGRLHAIALAVLLVLFARAFARPVGDVDAHWHAASGRWILEKGRLPSADPFGMYQASDARARAILRGYWLAQLAIAGALETGGPRALVALKAFLLLSALAATPYRAWRRSGPVAALAATALTGWVLARFDGERPQLFAFVLAAWVLAVLDRRALGWGSAAVLLASVVLWPNLHPSAALGALLLVAWAVGGALSIGGQASRARLALALAAAVLATCAAALAPAGLDVWRTLVSLEGSELQRKTSEWTSPWALTSELGIAMPEVWALVGLCGLALVGLVRGRRLQAALPLGLLVALSLRSYRFVPFLAVVGTAWVPEGLGRLLPASFVSPPRSRQLQQGLGVAALAVGLLLAASAPGLGDGLAAGRYPVLSARLLSRLPPHEEEPARVFDHLDFGGYLLWTCPDAVRPLVDGRLLDVGLLAPYTNVLWATEPGLAYLEGEGFRFLLVRPANALTGEAYPIVAALKQRPRWRLLVESADEVMFERVR